MCKGELRASIQVNTTQGIFRAIAWVQVCGHVVVVTMDGLILFSVFINSIIRDFPVQKYLHLNSEA